MCETASCAGLFQRALQGAVVLGLQALRFVEETARLLWEHRPVAFYTWSGVEQHSNAAPTARAIGILYALTGSFDAPGGNVLLPGIKKNLVDGRELLSAAQREKALGLARHPLGPSRWEFVTSDDLYTAGLESTPYRARFRRPPSRAVSPSGSSWAPVATNRQDGTGPGVSLAG